MIIIVSGLPGSGKSYFASRLAARLSAAYLNSDQVRKSMQTMGRYSPEDKALVYKHMAEQTMDLTAHGRTVIVDATFYHHSMRDLFINLAEQQGSEIFFILIEASEQLSRVRLSHPRADSEADFGVYQSMKAAFEKYSLPHLRLESKDDNIEEMLALALDYLKENHEKH